MDDIKRWINAWKIASTRLKAERIASMRKEDYHSRLCMLDDAIEWSIKNSPILPTSGLVQQQAKLQRIRK